MRIIETVVDLNFKPLFFYYICSSEDLLIRRQLALLLVLFYNYSMQPRKNNGISMAYFVLNSFSEFILVSNTRYLLYPVFYSGNPIEGLFVGLFSQSPLLLIPIMYYYATYTDYNNRAAFRKIESMIVRSLGFDTEEEINPYIS